MAVPPKRPNSRAPEAPRTSKGDVVHAIVKTAAAAIPGVGSAFAEAFILGISAPLERRRTEWMETVADMLDELTARVDGLSIEGLCQDEKFVSAFMAISAAAVRTHQREKLDALRNALAQAALGAIPDYDERAMLLHLLERLTPLHLAVLRFFHEPRADETIVRRFADSNGALGMVMEAAIPSLCGRQDIHDLIWRELHAAGLLDNSNLSMMMTGHGLLQRRTTDLGNKLIAFVTKPEVLG